MLSIFGCEYSNEANKPRNANDSCLVQPDGVCVYQADSVCTK